MAELQQLGQESLSHRLLPVLQAAQRDVHHLLEAA